MTYIDGMLRLPKESLDLKKIKDVLTVFTKGYKGSEKVLLFEETDKYIGIPRSWGLDNRKWLISDDIEDRTNLPFVLWPAIRFPEGKTYWKGQRESVQAIALAFSLGKYGALLEAPCGSGKTLMGLDIASRLSTPTLIVVHKGDLAEQWHQTAKEMFPRVTGGHVQGDHWLWRNRHYVTAMAQTLYRRIDEYPNGFLSNFGLVIFDEGHRYPARTFEHVLRVFPSRYRLAVSATWKRSDGLECIWHWHVGHIEHRMLTTRLTGEYAQVLWQTNLSDSMFRSGRDICNAKWLSAIAANAPYNKWLADQLAEGASLGRRVCCLSDRVSHLEDLRARLLGSGKTIGMYIGSMNGKRTSKSDLEFAKKCDIILATYGMMSEGTDMPFLDTLFLGTPRADIEQSVGRIQRPVEKKSLLIVDPIFSTGYMWGLARKREKVYVKLGFKKHDTGT